MLRRSKKGVVKGADGKSTWKLKSPVIINSAGVVARVSSRSENSERKVAEDAEGGR